MEKRILSTTRVRIISFGYKIIYIYEMHQIKTFAMSGCSCSLYIFSYNNKYFLYKCGTDKNRMEFRTDGFINIS